MFIIVKKTNQPIVNVTPNMAYAGPTCSWAGVEPGNQYQERKTAEIDASYLERSSTSAFTVVELQ